jgi:molecular chaperone DnaK (HSP70)
MEGPSRYLIGIDLGTTNSAVAFVDTRERERSRFVGNKGL